MAVEITSVLTQKVADLACLELTEAEVRDFTAQLGEVLHYIDQLSEIDVKGVEPLTYPHEMDLVLRDDSICTPELDARGKPKILEHAPDVLSGGFKVPPIL